MTRWTACTTPDDAAAARRGASGLAELLDRVEHGATRCERVGAALGLGSVIPEGRDAIIDLLARTDDDELRLVCVAGLPLGDPPSVAAAVKWHPLPADAESVGLFMMPPWAFGDPIPLQHERKTIEEHAWDLVHSGNAASIGALIPLLASPDVSLRHHAAWALRTIINEDFAEEPNGDAEAALAKLAADPDPLLRVAGLARPCAWDMGVAFDESHQATMQRALRDPDPLVKHAGLVLLSCQDGSDPSRTSLRNAPTRAALAALLEVCVVDAIDGGDYPPMSCAFATTDSAEHVAVIRPWLRELSRKPGPLQAAALNLLGRWTPTSLPNR